MKEEIKKLLESMLKNSLNLLVTRPSQVLMVMRGIPGSGKSTTAKTLAEGGAIHSTDNLIEAQGDYRAFFEKMNKDNNFSMLSKMHAQNLKNSKKSMFEGISPVIIDNTNLTASEMKNYVMAALEMGYADDNIKIVNVGTGGVLAEELAQRNTHGVPLDKINQMIQRYKSAGEITLKEVLAAKDLPQSSDILYSAVVLDAASHDTLLNKLVTKIPEGWKTFCHHMTIAFGKSASQEDLGKEVSLNVFALGLSDMAIAVKVEGYPSTKAIPHITIAVNPEGGKPAMSDNITNWNEIIPITVHGVVTNIMKSLQ